MNKYLDIDQNDDMSIVAFDVEKSGLIHKWRYCDINIRSQWGLSETRAKELVETM